MDIAELVVYNLASNVYDFSCLLFWVAVRLFSILVFIGQWGFNFLELVYCSVDHVLKYLSNCNKGITGCTVDAVGIFTTHLSEFYNNIRAYMSLWELIAVCAWTSVIVRSPEMRKMVISCITFLIAAAFAILRKIVIGRSKVAPSHSSSNFSAFTLLAVLLQIPFRIFKGFARLFRGRRKRTAGSTKNSGDTSMSCVVCWERPKCVLLMPCKHVCLCSDCLNKVMYRQRHCPLCRKTVTNSMKIYF